MCLKNELSRLTHVPRMPTAVRATSLETMGCD